MAGGDDLHVSVRGVAKKFARSLKRSFVYGAQDIARLLLRRPDDGTLRPTEFWAVRDVSFELRRGRSIGIIGDNGSGKTTLLRMVCGILRPNRGSVQVAGRIAPMLALGAGFKPVLSGRQNVFLNLALLGVGERAARGRFDAIVEYAELKDAIDAPLGTYSSGMQARLGFACAVHTEPSLLVVDEVLAVGDARFRMKCRNTINELRRAGTSLLLVSHSPVLVETLSDECLWLKQGQVAGFGPAPDVLRAYDHDARQRVATPTGSAPRAPRELAAGRDVVLRAVALRRAGAPTEEWVSGGPAELLVAVRAAAPLAGVSVNVMLFDLANHGGDAVLLLMSARDHGFWSLPAGDSEIVLTLPHLGLRPGTYRCKVSCSRGEQHDLLDVVDQVRITVRDRGGAEHCAFHQERRWSSDHAEVGERAEALGEDPAASDEA